MRLDALFSDHMVLQARKPIRVFGEGAGRASVCLDGDFADTESSGPFWCATLPARDEGGPYDLTVSLDGEETVLRDVYVGDVYLLAGQSNMQFKLRESSCPEDQWVEWPLLRGFSLARPEAGEPYAPEDGWQVCSRDKAGDFSAIGYHLGEMTRAGRAVGLIICYQGASVIESWLPEGAAASLGISVPLEDRHVDHTWPEYTVWNQDGYLYRHMFRKLPPLSLSAVIWYQGESDTTEAEARVYDRELECLVRTWRGDLGDSSLPFVIVQIADYQPRSDEGWRALQRAQQRVAADIPFAALVRSADICESDNIHPATKSRLAALIADVLKTLST